MTVILALLIAARTIRVTISNEAAKPTDAVFCVYGQARSSTVVDYFSLCWLLYAFISRTGQVYVRKSGDEDDDSRHRFFDGLKRWINPNTELTTPLRRSLARISKIKQRNLAWPKPLRISLNVQFGVLAYKEFVASFAYEIVWTIFGFVYGATLSAEAWQFCQSLDADLGQENCLRPALQMGFGQIVPLVLLILPFLNWVTGFFGQYQSVPLIGH